MELLRAGDVQAVGALAADQPQTVRFLLGRLWDPDETMRRRAAEAVGVAATSSPELGVELLRRLMWALNDESATNGLFGIPALAEIGLNDPELARPFVAPLASLSWDKGLRPEILRALTRMAKVMPDAVRSVCDLVAENIDLEDPSERDAFARLLEESGGIDES